MVDPIFIGEEKKEIGIVVLWEGGIEIKVVDTIGEYREKSFVRRFCGIEPQNRLIVFGFFILSPIDYKTERCIMDAIHPGNDIFTAFRAMQAMSYLPKWSNKAGNQYLLWRSLRRYTSSRESSWLKDKIGEPKFKEILNASIPYLERAVCVSVGLGLKLDPAQFQEEIDAGAIQYAEYMSMINVESPEMHEIRKKRRSQITAPYRDKVIECLIVPEFRQKADPIAIEEIDKAVYGAISRGARGESIIVGAALGRIMYQLAVAQILEVADLPQLYFCEDRKEAAMRQIGYKIARELAGSILEKFPGTFTPEEYTKIIGKIIGEWENMPEVDI